MKPLDIRLMDTPGDRLVGVVLDTLGVERIRIHAVTTPEAGGWLSAGDGSGAE